MLSNQTPSILYDSELCLATNDGSLSSIIMTSHLNLPTIESKNQLKTFIQMRKLEDAWHLCKTIEGNEEWNILGRAAITDLDIPFGMMK